jgi:chaperonin cofactor prefoldin
MQPDYFGLLENVILEIDNVPSEVQHVFTELQNSNTEIISIENRTKSYDIQLRKLMRIDTNPLTTKRTTHNPVEKLLPLETTTEFPELTPEELQEQIHLTNNLAKNVISIEDQVKLYNKVQDEYTRANVLSQERIDWTEKITEMLDKHIKKLDSELLKLEDGDISISTPLPISVYNTPAAEPVYVAPTRSAVIDTPVPVVTSILY